MKTVLLIAGELPSEVQDVMTRVGMKLGWILRFGNGSDLTIYKDEESAPAFVNLMAQGGYGVDEILMRIAK